MDQYKVMEERIYLVYISLPQSLVEVKKSDKSRHGYKAGTWMQVLKQRPCKGILLSGLLSRATFLIQLCWQSYGYFTSLRQSRECATGMFIGQTSGCNFFTETSLFLSMSRLVSSCQNLTRGRQKPNNTKAKYHEAMGFYFTSWRLLESPVTYTSNLVS